MTDQSGRADKHASRSSHARKRSRGAHDDATAELAAADDLPDDGDVEPVPGGNAEPIHRRHTTGPVRRTAPRPHKSAEAEVSQRANPAQFAKQSVAELKKVKWPTGDQLGQSFVVVLVFVVVIMAIVAGLDFGFGKLLLKLLG